LSGFERQTCRGVGENQIVHSPLTAKAEGDRGTIDAICAAYPLEHL
jgi:hypothetical protein